ncbi:AtpZ/AtpI family protein [Thermovenabulum gondwanense]|uniref:AtpZ/AtpI family protein n=1 Tax=Thermovenabulum gondwanense TaxID=520767 RepID=UPI001FE059B2|nr:AtpZ/AtpI family protein [Thermovenabulum gondwanense]
MKEPKSLQKIFQILQIGFNFALPIGAGAYFGAFLDRTLKTEILFLLIGTVLGIISGIASAYRILSEEFRKKPK